ncbi:glycosyltransferase [Duganella sp. FT92W]|uniref:Glycosyltransferase n=1 Tax=Pseudoduganella rivuli TaxID=2666085 RepID=A0A7X2LU14_9BURK|nr:glycosyltransferase [Pseudoduganella rivuli]MRV75180.1 glycosyltransferase [Pseudoduganella rivuli]
MEVPTTNLLACQAATTCPPLVVHITDALDTDAEEGLLSLLHQMPPGRYRHVVIGWRHGAMWELRHSGHLAQVVRMPLAASHVPYDCRLPALRLFRRLKQMRPALIHTRSAALQWLAALAGVPVRLHDASAAGCAPRRHGLRSWLARLLTPSAQPRPHAAVDCLQFHPRLGPPAALGPAGYLCDGACVIGAAGPMDGAHGHLQLVDAFLHLLAFHGATAPLRLLIIGDGPERIACKKRLADAGAAHLAWLPGQRDDVARLMRVMDIFAAPECTPESATHVLQAMASGLPVVACQGGAHSHLVQTGWTGAQVPQGDATMLAETLSDYVRIPGLARRHGLRGRRQVLSHHSLAAVAEHYTALYDRLIPREEGPGTAPAPGNA